MGNIQNIEIDYLNSYWSNLKSICEKFDKEIKLKPTVKIVKGSLIKIINYSDLGNNWDVNRHINGNSKNLEMFRNKLIHMIIKGDAINIKPMIEAICSGRIKTFRFKDKKGKTINKGKGNFRFGDAIKLNKEELNFIKQYFNYN
jgi:hypothetical protein